MNEALVALMAAVFGGAGLKVIEHVLSRTKDKVDFAAQLRDELRTEVTSLRTELKGVDDSLDVWKQRYFALLAHYNDMRVKCSEAGLKIDPFVEHKSKGE